MARESNIRPSPCELVPLPSHRFACHPAFRRFPYNRRKVFFVFDLSSHLFNYPVFLSVSVRSLEDSERLSEHGIRDGYTIYSVPTFVEIPSIPNL
ncbi:unnamed protein product [Heligmosomoides polygyrus]|uniref:Uncharacterized protein n=1 Tax=Heligmosomoides polygyrus TaxID=6339 RepID=A0A183FPM3_HELPZ|nr:unnamed protein product [Heligmosomoides polygyrus]